ncbi:MAG: hypothetical protein ABJH63_01965 [Rhizobiaceae bacterium]
MRLKTATASLCTISRILLLGATVALPSAALGEEILIDEFADFSQKNGGYSNGNIEGETIILQSGVEFTTDGTLANAKFARADGVTMQNHGTINISGDFTNVDGAAAIRLTGVSNGLIINNGIINATGTASNGIFSGGFNNPENSIDAIIINNHTINIDNLGSSRAASGINAIGIGVQVHNAGLISAINPNGYITHGIQLKVHKDHFVSNTGTIIVKSRDSSGIFADLKFDDRDADLTIFNSGRIESHGRKIHWFLASDAISIDQDTDSHRARVFNTGEVIAYDEDGSGIHSHMGGLRSSTVV